jgi:hypothetical protein
MRDDERQRSDMTSERYSFETNIPDSEWAETAQFGSLVKRGAHRLIRVVAAADEHTIGDALAAAILGFSQLRPEARAQLYAAIPTGEERATTQSTSKEE